MTRRSRRLFAALLGVAVLMVATPALAHRFDITPVRANFSSPPTYTIDVEVELYALMAGQPPRHVTTGTWTRLAALPQTAWTEREATIRQFFRSRTAVLFDEERAYPEARLMGLSRPAAAATGPPTETFVRLEGSLSNRARTFRWAMDPGLGTSVLQVRTPETATPSIHLVSPGELSEPIPLRTPGAGATAWRYLRLGFEHILPLGVDHILFVLGLFLLNIAWRPLLWQVSAFTAAHTMTLGLAAAGWVSVPATIVEPLIALSIAWVAVENLFTRELKPWRPAVVFGFGLLHGLGFAGMLGELGLPEGRFLTALLSFNVGVELGQVSVLAAAGLLLGWTRHRSWHHRLVTVPLSLAIAAVGLYWTVTRILEG